MGPGLSPKLSLALPILSHLSDKRNPPKHQTAMRLRAVNSLTIARSAMNSMFSGMRLKASRGKRIGAAMARMSSACLPRSALFTDQAYARRLAYAKNITTNVTSRKAHSSCVCTCHPCSSMDAHSSTVQPRA